jgi:vacuolar-type H+-ATPase subunit H
MDILGEIVKVERDIENRFQIELKKSREQLENVKLESEEELKQEEEKAKRVLNESLEANRQKAEIRAQNILVEANLVAEKYERLTDEALKGIMRRHIIRIIPEGGLGAYDSQDVKNRIGRTKGTS